MIRKIVNSQIIKKEIVETTLFCIHSLYIRKLIQVKS